MVFAESASVSLRARMGDWPAPPRLAEWDESRVTDSDEEVVVSHNWDELRRFMWDYVGVVRTSKRLERAQRRASLLLSEIDEYYGNFRIGNDLIELRNLAVVGNLIIESALARRESRGLHYTLDFPEMDTSAAPADTVLTPPGFDVG
jgi:L-aspartate oxidase